jgi:short-subunit dehydrogenase
VKLAGRRVLLTGATGGIGRVVARRLLEEGAHVLLSARDGHALDSLARSLAFAEDRVHAHRADLAQPEARAGLCDLARRWHGGIDVLINNAGLNSFSMYEDLTPEQIDQCLSVNVHAPMHLCRELLPWLRTRDTAAIVNVGSVFGAIGLPGYATYAATKFAIRGFSEALRRELADSRVRVKHLAPRATRTAMNSSAVMEMNARLKVAMDPPERVARELIALLERPRFSAVVGWPEKFFVKLNAVLPGVVDRAIRGQLSIVRAFARRHSPGETSPMKIKSSLHRWIATLVFAAALLPVGRHALAEDAPFAAELVAIQQDWDKANYQAADASDKERRLEALSARSEMLARQYPRRAEPLVWEGIVLSSYAGAKGGLGALSLAKKSRDCLIEASRIDPAALNGSAFTSLGALYYKVPRWPVGFGDRGKAAEFLNKALTFNPDGMDPNYFLGELLYEQGEYARSLRHLQTALAAPARPERPVGDAGRRAEVLALVAKVNSKLQ